jgi:galactonate dehydratase
MRSVPGGVVVMKIADIQSFVFNPNVRNQQVVRIESDNGYYGWGEAGLSTRDHAVGGAVAHFRDFLLGQDPRRIGRIWQEVYRSQYFEGGRVLTSAMSAIDIALHDLVAKSMGVPVYQLLGGRQRDYVPCFITTQAQDLDGVIDEARKYVAEGWECIRTSIHSPEIPAGSSKGPRDLAQFEPRVSVAVTAEWHTALRAAVGPGPVLGPDYHHRLSVAEAASFCQRMPHGTIDFLEEPIRDESPKAYAALRSMTDVPFAIGEEFASKWQFAPYIEDGLTNFARLDVCNVGGFTEAMKVAGWCETHYIDLMPHNPLGPVCTAASVHLGAAVPNFSWLEDRPDLERDHYDQMFPERPIRDGTWYPVPDGPGLGVEIDVEAIKALPVSYWECPHLTRSDGSVTNW